MVSMVLSTVFMVNFYGLWVQLRNLMVILRAWLLNLWLFTALGHVPGEGNRLMATYSTPRKDPDFGFTHIYARMFFFLRTFTPITVRPEIYHGFGAPGKS